MSIRSVDQKCRSEVSVGSVGRSVARKRRSELLLRSVDQKCRRSVPQKCCSDVSLRSVVRSVAQNSTPTLICRATLNQQIDAACFAVCLHSHLACSRGRQRQGSLDLAGFTKSVAQKRRLHVCVCVCSEVLLGSADQKHRSEVLLRTVGQRCRSKLSVSSVASAVLL